MLMMDVVVLEIGQSVCDNVYEEMEDVCEEMGNVCVEVVMVLEGIDVCSNSSSTSTNRANWSSYYTHRSCW